MRIRATIIDGLPSRLWEPGDQYMPFNHRPFSLLPEGSTFTEHALHFVGDEVRTVEWDGRKIARGRAKPFILPDQVTTPPRCSESPSHYRCRCTPVSKNRADQRALR
jgi:hypothetical protein